MHIGQIGQHKGQAEARREADKEGRGKPAEKAELEERGQEVGGTRLHVGAQEMSCQFMAQGSEEHPPNQ